MASCQHSSAFELHVCTNILCWEEVNTFPSAQQCAGKSGFLLVSPCKNFLIIIQLPFKMVVAQCPINVLLSFDYSPYYTYLHKILFIPDTCIRHIAGRLNSRSRQGQLYSPNYPMEYPSNVECIWKITVPENSVLRLTFEDFDTECSHDYLEIHHLKTADGTIER